MATVTIICAAVMVFVSGAYLPAPAAKNSPAFLKEMGEAFVEVAQKVTPAVVNIMSSKTMAGAGPGAGQFDKLPEDHPFKEFFGDDLFKKFFKGPYGGGKGFRRQGVGSGVIVSADGVILTNAHVVKDADEIKVTLPDKRTFDAKVIGADPESDIAVIKVNATNLPVAQLGDSSKMRVGEIVLAVGNPFKLSSTVTSGIVSATGRTNVGIIDYEDFIQTDAAINPGNSGGPLVNVNGEVIGINTAIATGSGGYQGVGFAIPSNTAAHIMNSLLKEGKVRRGLLGVHIQDLTPSLAKSFGREEIKGALVSQVISGSPAEKAGVQSGDIVLKYNGQPVEGAAQLKNMVGVEKPGATATLTIFRKGSTLEKKVMVGERDSKKIASEAQEETESGKSSTELGIAIEPVPQALAEKLNLPKGKGVRVADVQGDGVGQTMGLKAGDIILEVDDKVVDDVASFKTALQESKKSNVVRLKVQRGNNTLFFAGNLK
ncbi:MAG: DegQ family serine endoprotease [Deltaproteobacteria bacterium]|nr:DegQ family serine endoprotease [Deltaproteobacteria bacterium]